MRDTSALYASGLTAPMSATAADQAETVLVRRLEVDEAVDVEGALGEAGVRIRGGGSERGWTLHRVARQCRGVLHHRFLACRIQYPIV